VKEIREEFNRNIKQKKIVNKDNATPGRVTRSQCNIDKQSNHSPEKRSNAWGNQTAETNHRRIGPAIEELQYKDSPIHLKAAR